MKYLFTTLLCLACFGCKTSQSGNYSKGERIGVVFKYSQKGLFCKTWEGTANLGGMRMESDSTVPNVWDFTIRDSDTERFNSIIHQSMENGTTLKFTYEQEILPICNSENGYFVTGIEIAAKK